jgi:hypothetical protein
MSIAWINVRFMNLLPDGGACKALAYTGRSAVFDRRLRTLYDFRRLGADLVHEEIIVPEGVSPAFATIEAFGNAVDAAEFRRVRLGLDDRIRLPQVGAAIIVALPPDAEVNFNEANEILHRVAWRIRDGRLLPIHSAIHEPALLTEGAVTRHGHLWVPTRECHDGVFSLHKVTGMFARPRHSAGPNARACHVAEGISWPQVAFETQQTLFAECGIDLIMDPIAPYSEPHWTARIYRTDPERVGAHRSLARHLNQQAILGDPSDLLAGLLRGRSTFQIEELRRFIAKFVDAEAGRRSRLETILGDPNVETLAADPDAKTPRFVTPRAVHDSMVCAAALVDEAARETIAPAIRTVTAPDHAGVVAAIDALMRSKEFQRSARTPRPLFLGLNHSDAEHLAEAAAFARPVVATIKTVLQNPVPAKRSGARKRTGLRRGGIVVLPRGEAIDDQTLAALLLACANNHVTVILGHDQSRQRGIVCNRLAAYTVERLAAPEERTAGKTPDLETAERWLRSGLIGRAVERMAQQGLLSFAPVDDIASETRFDFVVCNDPRRIADTDRRLQTRRVEEYGSIATVTIQLPRGPIVLCSGQWIAFTRTDYSARPPRIRAGELAQIVDIDAMENTISVLLSGGGTPLVDLERFPHIRSAFALSIREARQIKRPCRLRIEISDARHSWAGLLLAARQQSLPTIIVDPRVAQDVPALITVVRASLPGTLPHELTPRRDPDAELAKVLIPTVAAPLPSEAFEIENMPVPDPPEPADLAPLVPVHEHARAMIASHADARRGYQLLRQRLRADNPDRDAAARHILDLCDPQGLTAAIVRSLIAPDLSQAARTEAGLDADFDLPEELDRQAPREWGVWELYCCKLDLATMTFPSRWNMVPPQISDLDSSMAP